MVNETEPGAAADVLLRISTVAIRAKDSAQILSIGFMGEVQKIKFILIIYSLCIKYIQKKIFVKYLNKKSFWYILVKTDTHIIS